jgi:hypothetical protein
LIRRGAVEESPKEKKGRQTLLTINHLPAFASFDLLHHQRLEAVEWAACFSFIMELLEVD